MHFFLQGPRGIGKSYLLREALEPYCGRLAGFTVQRLYREGEIVGFRAQSVREGLLSVDGEYDAGLSGIFLYRGARNVAVLDSLIARVEWDIRRPECGLVLLDEIGGVELVSPAFMEPLRHILGYGKPCVGVFKSARNLAHTARRQKLENALFEAHQRLEQELTNHGRLCSMTEENRQECAALLTEYLANLPIGSSPRKEVQQAW